MIRFEGYERRIDKIQPVLDKYGFADFEAVRDFTLAKGIDVDKIVRSIQMIAFENAVWAYTLGAAIALKKDCKVAAEAAELPRAQREPQQQPGQQQNRNGAEGEVIAQKHGGGNDAGE
jgi:hypothetical protein